MKRLAIGFGTALLLVTLSYGQSTKTEDFLERPFQERGKIELRLSSGSYKIRPSIGNRILVRWEVKKPGDMEGIRVRIDTSGAAAEIRTDGPARRADFVIEVPMRSDIYVRMRAGEITIEGIEGDKQISMTAGDIEIDTDPMAYEKVHASVTFGDLSASAFDVSKSGIGRSFNWRGAGPYTLRASLFAGDIKLVGPRKMGS